VLVTGASDGIGKGFCDELAREGFNIILVARNKDNLQKASESLIKINSKIKTHTISFDFIKQTSIEEYTQTFGKLQETFDISILINNIGTNYKGSFEMVPIEKYYDMISINTYAQSYLTKIFCEKMTLRANRSAVIDLSSFSCYSPLPLRSVYAATKTYNFFLSQGLSYEFKNKNIDFLCVSPLYVQSSLIKEKGWAVISPQQCASGALNDLGYVTTTYGHWFHKIQAFVVTKIPLGIMKKRLMSQIKNMESDQKKEKEQ